MCLAFENESAWVPTRRPPRVSGSQGTRLAACLGACVRVRVVQEGQRHGQGENTETHTHTHTAPHLVVGPRLAHGAWRGRACVRARRGSEASVVGSRASVLSTETHTQQRQQRQCPPSQSATESLASRGDEEGGARLRLPHTDRPSALRERQQRQTRTSTQPGAAPRAPTNAAEACHTRCGTGTERDGRRGRPRSAPPTPAACVR